MDSISKLENSIEHANKRVSKAKKVKALYDHPDFNEIVVKGFFEQESIRMVARYGDGTTPAEELIDLQKDMHAVGAFRRYLSMIVQDGRNAESDIRVAQEALEEELAMQAEARSRGEDLPAEVDPDYAGNLGA
jgi:hypothetical protein